MVAYVPFLAGRELTADLLNTRLIEEIMEWTPLDDVGNFSAGFTAASDTPRMRKVRILGVERWEYAGRVNIAALTANTDTLMFTFDVGFRPVTQHVFPLGGANTLFYTIRGSLPSSGGWTVGVPTAAGNGTSAVFLDGLYIDNPLAV